MIGPNPRRYPLPPLRLGSTVAIPLPFQQRRSPVRLIGPRLGPCRLRRLFRQPSPHPSRHPSRLRANGVPAAGFYVVDTNLGQVLVASASQFSGHSGAAIVGTEVKGQMWLVEPHGSSFDAVQVQTNLADQSYNLEGATFVP